MPTRTAKGVANPNEQGQDTTSTDTAAIKASLTWWPILHRTAMDPKAKRMTNGTNLAATESARRCMCTRVVSASSTSLMILESSVSSPTAVASIIKDPGPLSTPPLTVEPGDTSIDADSPVAWEASTSDIPSVIWPSVATLSPGAVMNSIPTINSAMGNSLPSLSNTCVGVKLASARKASPEVRIARASHHLPTRTRATIALAPPK